MSWKLELNQAESYEAYLVPTIFAGFTEALIELADIHAGQRVLDVGCGTGIVSRVAAPLVGSSGRVAGLDIDRQMLAVARSADNVRDGAIKWHQADVARMPFRDASFDLALCQAALQFFPNKRAALGEIRRVLTGQGRLVILCFRSIERNPGFEALTSALERHVGQEAADMRRAIFSLGEAEELTNLLDQSGFNHNLLKSVSELVRFPSAEEFARRQIASQSPWVLREMGERTRTALSEEMNSLLAGYVDDQGLSFPMEAHIVVASG